MLNTRVSALLIGTVIVIAFMVFSDVNRIALCCPVSPPMPLRALYNGSDRIVVARIGASMVIEVGDGYLRLRTALHVSSTIKGKDDEPIVFFEHWTGTKGFLASRADSKGDKVLAFLTRRDEGAYAIVDQRYGLKDLSDSDLKVYLQRISELAKIMEGGTTDPADLVEWLVRCVEEPATRWEGAYELNQSASMTFDDSAKTEEDASVPDEGEESLEDDEPEIDSAAAGEEAYVDEEGNLISTFALLLTESQRHRLVDALTTSDAIGEGEQLLMGIASSWNDPRLVPFLVTQLRHDTDGSSYLAEDIMDVVARVLGDKTLASLSERYRELGSDTGEADDEQAAQSDDAGPSDVAVNSAKKAVLEKFLARVEKRLKR